MVACRLSHQLVEPGVVADKDAVIVSGPAHLFQDLCELDETAIADLLRRLGRRRRLQQHANLPQLGQALVPHQVGGEPDPVQQQLRPQAGHVRPVTATDVQHTSYDQRPDRFAYCAAGAAEDGRQFRLWRQLAAWLKSAADNQVPDVLDSLVDHGSSHHSSSAQGADPRRDQLFL
jgi:hypothetical protein